MTIEYQRKTRLLGRGGCNWDLYKTRKFFSLVESLFFYLSQCLDIFVDECSYFRDVLNHPVGTQKLALLAAKSMIDSRISFKACDKQLWTAANVKMGVFRTPWFSIPFVHGGPRLDLQSEVKCMVCCSEEVAAEKHIQAIQFVGCQGSNSPCYHVDNGQKQRRSTIPLQDWWWPTLPTDSARPSALGEALKSETHSFFSFLGVEMVLSMLLFPFPVSPLNFKYQWHSMTYQWHITYQWPFQRSLSRALITWEEKLWPWQ